MWWLRAIVPTTKSNQLYEGAPFPATASQYLSKYGGCKKITFMTLVYDADIDK